MAISEKLDNTGILYIKGELDEVTGSMVSSNDTVYFAGEFDEVTISPISGGLAKRIHANGLIQVANYFDDYTLNSIVTRGLQLLLDAQDPDSYSGSGSTWYDVSGNDADVTLVNSPTFTNSTPKHFTFNGSTQYGTGSTAVLGTNNYTKQIWFQINTLADNNLMSSSEGGHFMYFGTATNRMYCGHTDFSGFMNYESTATFNTGQWYNAALTFDVATGFKLYINGVQDSTYSWTTARPGNGYTNIAAFATGNNLNGKIAQALAYNVTLTAEEVSTNFEASRGYFGV
jgi:Concanavalin A-like lectin/glucanases superfamily